MRDIDSRALPMITREYDVRVAEVGDALIERFGLEVTTNDGCLDLDVFDYVINRAVEFEWFIDLATTQLKRLMDADDKHGAVADKMQNHHLTDLGMMELRTRQCAFKLIELRLLVQHLHGHDQGACEHG